MSIYIPFFKFIFTLFIFIYTNLAIAQNPYFDWGKGIGTAGIETIDDIAVDDQNNSYIIGTYVNTIDIDPGSGVYMLNSFSSSAYDYNIFVLKLNSDGNFVWARRLGSNDAERARAIVLDGLGNLYYTGTFANAVNFDPGGTNQTLFNIGPTDIFVHKLDTNGNHIWAKKFHGAFDEDVYDMEMDIVGNLVLTGEFDNNLRFDNTAIDTLEVTSYATDDAFVLKMNSAGNVIWAKSFGGTGYDRGSGVDIDNNNDILLTGYYSNGADLDPDTLYTFNIFTSIQKSSFILKLSQNGIFKWAKANQGNGTSSLGNYGNDIIHDQNNNIYVCGNYADSIDLDPGTSILHYFAWPTSDGYIQKLDSLGNLKWVTIIKGSSYDYTKELAIDSSQFIYLTGNVAGNYQISSFVDTLNGLLNGYTQILLLKIDTSGYFEWSNVFGSPMQDEGLTIAVSENMNVYIGGYLGVANFDQGIADLDPGTSSYNYTLAGNSDGFIVKLNQCFDPSQSPPTPLIASLPTIIECCSATLTAPIAIHPCAGTIIGIPSNSNYTYSIEGSYVVDWIYDDGYGHVSHQFQTVVIHDSLFPTPLLNSLPDIIEECSVNVVTVPQAIDNCDGLIYATTLDMLNYSFQGIYSITWIFVDSQGNQTAQNQNIIIEDVTAPIPDVLNLASLYTECPPFTLIPPTATDNCTGSIFGTTAQPMVYTLEGIYTINWEFVDNAGNTAYQNQQLILETIDNNITIISDTLMADAGFGYSYQWLDCQNSYAIILGETQYFFIPNDSLDYAVVVSNGNCSVTSDCYSILPTDWNVEETKMKEIIIYPNPSQFIIKVIIPSQEIGSKFFIQDETGRIVEEGELLNVMNEINIADLSNGMYYIYALQIGSSFIKK